ncbi:hypothetical protein RJT34_20178 [Clitoria ternatea]|uniref:BSD domain-containing protein n=1 Tax=Clitoria ternatea TaxID=43366 RepID=A0AAN9P4N1_CLITE
MDFFKSIFSDDPDPSESYSKNTNPTDSQDESSRGTSPTELQSTSSGSGDEFGTGLKKEIEVAQGSLENVGHVIDHFRNAIIKGMAQIMSHDNDANEQHRTERNFNSKRYSRLDAQVHALQDDVRTFCDVPEDLEEYGQWKLEFSLDGKSEEMEGLLRENEAMESVFKRVVPNTIDCETFWVRYYYRVYRLNKAEDVRARLVKRMSWEEEELSWDFEDDDVDEDNGHVGHGKVESLIKKEVGGEKIGKESSEEEAKLEKRDDFMESKELGNKKDESVAESKVDMNKEVVQEMGNGSNIVSNDVNATGDGNGNGAVEVSDEKVVVERKDENGKSSMVASEQRHSGNEEEDLKWDEIEDLSTIDEKKANETGSPSKVDFQKRLNVAQEEDLSWDIEDDGDDEPAKA